MDPLVGLLGSEVRARLIVHFVVHPESRLGARALARHLGVPGKRSLQIEVDRLIELGLLERHRSGREALITRSEHPQWKALSLLVAEYAPTLILRDALADVPGLEAAFIFGSFARGDARPDSDIDLLLYGDEIPDEALSGAIIDAAIVINRRLDTKRLDAERFRHHVLRGWGFLPHALEGPKIWLVGSADNLPSVSKLTERAA
jgi:predicted nucleotidyltransferase